MKISKGQSSFILDSMHSYLVGKVKDRLTVSGFIEAEGVSYNRKTAIYFYYGKSRHGITALSDIALMMGIDSVFDSDNGIFRFVEKPLFAFKPSVLPGYIELRHNASPFFVLCFDPINLGKPISMVYSCIPHLCRNGTNKLLLPIVVRGVEFYLGYTCSTYKRRAIARMLRSNMNNHPNKFMYVHLSKWDEFLETYKPDPFKVFEQEEIR